MKDRVGERPLLVQCHWSDFDSFRALVTDPVSGLVARARKEFDNVVLVCGEDPKNECVHEFARRAGVLSFAGDDRDIGRRMGACMEHFAWPRAARALAHQFTVDLVSVLRAFEQIEREGTQYAMLPRHFDLRFGCDVFSADFLDVARKVTADAAPQHQGRLTHTPWAAAELAPDRFRLSHFVNVPTWGPARFRQVRETTHSLYPERSREEATPLPGYEQALELLAPDTQQVLDIACGSGAGTACLAERFSTVIGADRNAEQIERNRRAHPSASFVVGDATSPDLFDSNSFDAIVSVHSMEHFREDQAFLAACSRWLRPGGQFVLEVPLIMDSPFPGIDTPLGEGHVREYRVSSLLDRIGLYFRVERAFGVSRGLYLGLDRARNAVLLSLRPR